MSREISGGPIDPASVAVFRIVFGLLCLGLVVGVAAVGAVAEWESTCAVRLHWIGLSWLSAPCQPWATRGVGVLVGICSLLVALGAFYRFAAPALATLLCYGLLADQAFYSSTYYLLCLFALGLAAAPAEAAFSVDVWRGRSRAGRPGWPLNLLRFHTAQMYVYAAIAKLDGDWLAGRSLEVWLSNRADVPVVGAIDPQVLAPMLAWSGLAFDAGIVPAVLWPRTRAPALGLAVAFHAFNGLVLDVFPLPILAMAATLLLLPADWPRRWLRRSPREAGIASAPGRWLRVGIGAWVALHLSIPFRHLLYPGPVAWNEDGDEFAWRLRVRAKDTQLRLWLVDRETGTRERVVLADHLNWLQRRAVRTFPDRLLQFAHQLAAQERTRGRDVAVKARVRVGLNGRPRRDLVPRDLDLSRQPRTFLASSWLEPFAP